MVEVLQKVKKPRDATLGSRDSSRICKLWAWIFSDSSQIIHFEDIVF